MAYYAVPENGLSIASFVHRVKWLWIRSLRRRRQRQRMNWKRYQRIIARYLLQIRILHPQPLHRFDAKHPRKEPNALAAHAGNCAGGAA